MSPAATAILAALLGEPSPAFGRKAGHAKDDVDCVPSSALKKSAEHRARARSARARSARARRAEESYQQEDMATKPDDAPALRSRANAGPVFQRAASRERDLVISARATQRTTFIATARFGPVRIDSARIDSVRRRRVGFENDNWDRASSRLRGDLGSPTSTLTVGVHRQYHSEFHGSPGTAGAHHAPPRVGRVVAISSDESGKNEKGQRGRRPHGSRRPPRFFPIALRRPPIALP
jgi:hypothetical protein